MSLVRLCSSLPALPNGTSAMAAGHCWLTAPELTRTSSESCACCNNPWLCALYPKEHFVPYDTCGCRRRSSNAGSVATVNTTPPQVGGALCTAR